MSESLQVVNLGLIDMVVLFSLLLFTSIVFLRLRLGLMKERDKHSSNHESG